MINKRCRKILYRRFPSAAWLVYLTCAASCSFLYGAPEQPGLPAPTTRKVDFSKDIEPIFAKSCYSCHGEQKQKSGYRLDVKSIALKGGEHHAPDIIPGYVSTESRWNEKNTLILTFSKFSVNEDLKGESGGWVTVMTVGGTVNGIGGSSFTYPTSASIISPPCVRLTTAASSAPGRGWATASTWSTWRDS
jgi:hypothetical protein